ncbi:hypothetical protein Trihar35433_3018 [Trichoderma harzianum]|nr:hypothetical protein Trihar35433_3018 [Trichoderma harzianum]
MDDDYNYDMWLSACLPHDEGEMAVHEKTTPKTGLTHEGKRPAGGVSPRSTAHTSPPPATTGANDGGAAQVAPQYYRVPYHFAQWHGADAAGGRAATAKGGMTGDKLSSWRR